MPSATRTEYFIYLPTNIVHGLGLGKGSELLLRIDLQKGDIVLKPLTTSKRIKAEA